jgi:hypothetical protein
LVGAALALSKDCLSGEALVERLVISVLVSPRCRWVGRSVRLGAKPSAPKRILRRSIAFIAPPAGEINPFLRLWDDAAKRTIAH